MIGEPINPINNYNSGFSDGYAKGFQDGYQVGKLSGFMDNKSHSNSCSVCGMSFVDEMGRPKVMGYVCPNYKCPSKVSCSTGNHTIDWSAGVMSVNSLPFQDGMSYEEIYGSVVYQQNKKKES